MTPGARIAAAIEVLDAINDGLVAEQALSRWARGHRFAGSKDRAAIRDHVFDALRSKRSAAHLGGGEGGRAMMIGLLRQKGMPLDDVFSGEGHAPARLTPGEEGYQAPEMEQATAWNIPDWLLPHFVDAMGDHAQDAAFALMERAPITVRVNHKRANVPEVIARLDADGILAQQNNRAPHALTIIEGERKIRSHATYLDGLIEPQDASSQAVVSDLPDAKTALDFCAGGGGKALGMAAQGMQVTAHDVDQGRMRDIPDRAARAGVSIRTAKSSDLTDMAPFDLVLCDAPCSGSGAWRRAPEGKWNLDAERLTELTQIQDEVLDDALRYVGQGGYLVYATCSIFREENEKRIDAFLARHPEWKCTKTERYLIDTQGDGFFAAHFTR